MLRGGRGELGFEGWGGAPPSLCEGGRVERSETQGDARGPRISAVIPRALRHSRVRVLCITLPLDAQGGIKGGLDLPFRFALRCPAPLDSGFRRNDGVVHSTRARE